MMYDLQFTIGGKVQGAGEDALGYELRGSAYGQSALFVKQPDGVGELGGLLEVVG